MNLLKLQGGSTKTWDYTVLCLVIQSCPTLCDAMDCSLPGSSVHLDSPGRNTGCHALLQVIFPTQGSNPGLLHCRQILYWLSHQGIHARINSRFSCRMTLAKTSLLLTLWGHMAWTLSFSSFYFYWDVIDIQHC